MPHKAHLTLNSRMSGSRWVITPLWLSGSWRSFLFSSSVYSCHLFLVSSASVSSLPFLPFIEPIFAWNVPLVSLIFLKRSLVFPILLFSCFFALITEEGFLISPCYSLELCIQMGISFLLFFYFHFFSLTAICKASSDNHECMCSRFSHIRLCNSVDCSPAGSPLHGILQARILEWVPCPSPGDLPNAENTRLLPLSHCRQTFYCWATREAQLGPIIRQILWSFYRKN